MDLGIIYYKTCAGGFACLNMSRLQNGCYQGLLVMMQVLLSSSKLGS